MPVVTHQISGALKMLFDKVVGRVESRAVFCVTLCFTDGVQLMESVEICLTVVLTKVPNFTSDGPGADLNRQVIMRVSSRWKCRRKSPKFLRFPFNQSCTW